MGEERMILKDVEYLAFANLSYYDWHELYKTKEGKEITNKFTVSDILEELATAVRPLGKELVLLSEEKERLRTEKIFKTKERRKEYDVYIEYLIKNINNNNSNNISNKDKEILEKRNSELAEESRVIENKIQKINKDEKELRKLYKEIYEKNDELSKEEEEKINKILRKDEKDLNIDTAFGGEDIKLILSIMPRRKKPVYMPKPVYNKLRDKTIDMYQEDNQAIFFFYSELENKDDSLFIKQKKILSDWKVICSEEETEYLNSFQATAFKKGNDIVVAYRGTEFFGDYGVNHFIRDGLTDGGLYLFDLSSQRKFAHKFLKKIQEENENSNIHVVGHSLGGALANYSVVDLEEIKEIKSVVTFNALGIIDNDIYREKWTANKTTEEIIIETYNKTIRNVNIVKAILDKNAINFRDRAIDKLKNTNITTKNYILMDDTVANIKKNVGELVVDKEKKEKGNMVDFTYHSIYAFFIYLNDEGNFPNNEVNKGLKSKKLGNEVKEIHIINAIKSSLEESYGKGALALEGELNTKCKTLEEVKKYLNTIIKNSTRTFFEEGKSKDNYKLLIKSQIEESESKNYYCKYSKAENNNTYKIEIGKFNNYENLLGIKGNYPIILEWNANKEIRATGLPVLDGAILKCNQGSMSNNLKVTSQNKSFIEGKLQGTEKDYTGKKNIGPFGDCKLKPTTSGYEPCIMNISTSQWKETSRNNICGNKIILKSSSCKCNIGGKITVEDSLSNKTNCD